MKRIVCLTKLNGDECCTAVMKGKEGSSTFKYMKGSFLPIHFSVSIFPFSPYQSLAPFPLFTSNMSQKISNFVEWKGKWTSKLHSWETWEQEAGRPCEHFRKLLENDEYEEFVTLFQEVIGNREALVLAGSVGLAKDLEHMTGVSQEY
jgi:hypothetical protein